jgi:hypothetical protein
MEKLDMRNLPRLLIATALSTLAVSTVSLTTWADDSDPVKSSHYPYKAGRQIDDSGSAAPDDNDPVKTSRPPNKPGREIDEDGAQPVKPGGAPYKPGRQADETRRSSDSANN